MNENTIIANETNSNTFKLKAYNIKDNSSKELITKQTKDEVYP